MHQQRSRAHQELVYSIAIYDTSNLGRDLQAFAEDEELDELVMFPISRLVMQIQRFQTPFARGRPASQLDFQIVVLPRRCISVKCTAKLV